MKYLLLLALSFLVGCHATVHDRDMARQTHNQKHGQKYTKLTVTDLGGDLVSVWIAEGPVKKSDLGYTIRAVERQSAPPFPVVNHYPNGRVSTVAGQNIVLEDIKKPDWLRKLDGEQGD